MNQSHAQGQAQSQVDPHALAQVMSFMSTPAGVQSMAAFANHMTHGANPSSQASPASPSRNTQVAPRYSPQQQAGQKRKLGDRNNTAQPHMQPTPAQQSTKPPRAKAAVPPPVPSFGFSLPTPAIAQPNAASHTKSKREQKKRKLNLGLSNAPLQVEQPPSDAEAEEEDELDEEEAYAQKLKGGGFSFEHEGEQITIRTAAEVAAWIRDRRRNFPTQQRIVEKAQEKASKRASELEFLRRLKGVPPKTQEDTRTDQPAKAPPPPPSLKPPVKKVEKEAKGQEDLAALRKKLHQSMLDKQHKPPTINLGLGYDSESSLASDAESSTVSSSSEDSDSDADSDSNESDAEPPSSPPLPTSSKLAPPPIKIPPPAPKENLAKLQEQRGSKICDAWQRTGRCKFSNKCRYAHPARGGGEKSGLGVSLYERMVEQELRGRDELALCAIKALGGMGVLG